MIRRIVEAPGSDVSYQMCKTIYLYLPLGMKMAESPIGMAQSQAREINIQRGPEEAVRKAFLDELAAINADRYIFNTMRLSRRYRFHRMLVKGQPSESPVKFEGLDKANISFNVFDPLNTARSLVLSQRPNDMDFLKTLQFEFQQWWEAVIAA